MSKPGDTTAELVVLSGISGSGKSTALHALEDAGYFCVDNLPGPLLETLMSLADDHPRLSRVAVVTDVREASHFPDFARHLASAIDAGRPIRVLFLEAGDTRVITRFKETRRVHPLMIMGQVDTLGEALSKEREGLRPLRALASMAIDTTTLTVHELKRRVQALFPGDGAAEMPVHVTSFGFRHGIPPEADFVFDVRYLPNPYFVDGLREGTGLDEAVSAYVFEASAAQVVLDHIQGLLRDVLPLARDEGKPTMTVAIGCTGGHHRSVALAEALHKHLVDAGQRTLVAHRDIGR
jgi:UPF0042 nucleotide-binding protein